MCVIMGSVTGAKIDENWLRAGYDSNDHGAGMAWREIRTIGSGKNKKEETIVRWKKGILDIEEFLEAYRKIPEGIKHVVHFRIASCGGRVPGLTHPFPLTDDASLELEGATTGGVLFHNGHRHRYQDDLIETAQRSGGQIRIPGGPMSDTRAMAYLAHRLGLGMLPFFNEKLIYFSPDRFDVLGLGPASWTLRDKIHLSNTSWDYRLKDIIKAQERKAHQANNRPIHPDTDGTAQEVRPDNAPFRQSAEPGKGVAFLQLSPPSGMSKKQKKRWRKKMADKGLIAPGPVRHRAREHQKYLAMRTVN